MSMLPYSYYWKLRCVRCEKVADIGSAGFFTAQKEDEFRRKKEAEAKTLLCDECKQEPISATH